MACPFLQRFIEGDRVSQYLRNRFSLYHFVFVGLFVDVYGAPILVETQVQTLVSATVEGSVSWLYIWQKKSRTSKLPLIQTFNQLPSFQPLLQPHFLRYLVTLILETSGVLWHKFSSGIFLPLIQLLAFRQLSFKYLLFRLKHICFPFLPILFVFDGSGLQLSTISGAPQEEEM